MERVLCLDCSLRRTGVAVIDINDEPKIVYVGVISTSDTNTHSECLYQIQEHLRSLVNTYNPTGIVVEDNFCSKNPKTLKDLANVLGLVYSLCGEFCIEPVVYVPVTHKKATTGNAKATKQETVVAVERHFNFEVPYVYTTTGRISEKNKQKRKEEDIADALSLGYCYFIKNK